MQKNKTVFVLLSIGIILILSASVVYWHPFLSKQDAEHEIVSFMTELLAKQGPIGVETPSDYLYVQGFDNPIKHTEISDQPWLNAPQQTTMIVWSPPIDNFNGDINSNILQRDAPISVWWYFDNTLIAASNKTEAITKYVELYISNAPESGCSYNVSSFGILSLSSNKSDAKVFVSVGNGPLCGLQTTLLLHRNLFGEWTIIGTEGFARS